MLVCHHYPMSALCYHFYHRRHDRCMRQRMTVFHVAVCEYSTDRISSQVAPGKTGAAELGQSKGVLRNASLIRPAHNQANKLCRLDDMPSLPLIAMYQNYCVVPVPRTLHNRPEAVRRRLRSVWLWGFMRILVLKRFCANYVV